MNLEKQIPSPGAGSWMLEMPSSSTEFLDAVAGLRGVYFLCKQAALNFQFSLLFPSPSNAVRNPVISHCLAGTAVMVLD